jgi:hypothetical protein
VPKVKQEYVFCFMGLEGLSQVRAGRGRDQRIFFSAEDYDVVESRQQYSGRTADLIENRG